MASVWIRMRTIAAGIRYRVEYQLGGRGSRSRYGGSFKTMREATVRKNLIAGELAALRVPDLTWRAPRPTADVRASRQELAGRPCRRGGVDRNAAPDPAGQADSADRSAPHR